MPEQVGVAVQLYNLIYKTGQLSAGTLISHTCVQTHTLRAHRPLLSLRMVMLSAGLAQPLTLNPCSHNTVQAPGKWGSSQLVLWVCRIRNDKVRLLRFLGCAAAGLRLLRVEWKTQGMESCRSPSTRRRVN